MNDITLYVANAANTLTPNMHKIKRAFNQAVSVAAKELKADKIDVIVVDAPGTAIPELGVGGYTPGAHILYISIDPGHSIKEDDIRSCMLHEFHHAMRWREPGYGNTFRETLITEGLACLFEAEIIGTVPIYSKIELPKDTKALAGNIDSSDYDHSALFYGSKVIPKWFGYTLGYEIAKRASESMNKSAAELVHEPVDSFKNSIEAFI